MSRGRIIKAGKVRVGPSRRSSEPSLEDSLLGDGIEVSLRREGDLPEALEVHCACGRSTVVECLYDAVDGDEGLLPHSMG